MLTVLEWVYWIGFGLLMFIHLCGGHFFVMGTIKRNGRVFCRVPGFFMALVFSLGWPVILPIQLTQN
jgi:hypothetical protein